MKRLAIAGVRDPCRRNMSDDSPKEKGVTILTTLFRTSTATIIAPVITTRKMLLQMLVPSDSDNHCWCNYHSELPQ